jgi:hypothetical protein
LPGIDLSEVMHSWKSYTAKAINKALGRSGTLWKEESHDHLVATGLRLTVRLPLGVPSEAQVEPTAKAPLTEVE